MEIKTYDLSGFTPSVTVDDSSGGSLTTGGTVNLERQTDGTWPEWQWQWLWYWVNYQPRIPECSADIHVFSCPHCDMCKCGKAKKVT